MDNQSAIDIVLPWVDGNDVAWRAQMRQFVPEANDMNTESRFKNWDNLHYLLRGIENCMPWVRTVHFVTCGHTPEWLRTTGNNIKVVRHEDFIPRHFLPVFSCNPIEMFLHKIPGLSSQFIYFNDDFFPLKKCCPSDFFVDNKPVDFAIMDTIHDGTISHIVMNDVDVINRNFNRHIKTNYAKRKIIRDHWRLWFSWRLGASNIFQNLILLKWKGHTGFVINHHPQPYLTETFEEVWSKESSALLATAAEKFRSHLDLNQYVFRYWQLVKGQFVVPNMRRRKPWRYVEVRTKEDAQKVAHEIKSRRFSFYCINDATSKGRYTENEMSAADFERSVSLINDSLRSLFPEPSKYERFCADELTASDKY